MKNNNFKDAIFQRIKKEMAGLERAKDAMSAFGRLRGIMFDVNALSELTAPPIPSRSAADPAQYKNGDRND